MPSIYDWSTTPGSNDTADNDINWSEGQFPDTVNDSARQMMGRNAEWRNDLTGTITATGTANALLITANSSFTTLVNGRRIAFRAAANNSAAVSVNVNGIGSKKIRAMGATTDVDLVANDLKANGVYEIIYSSTADSGTGAWILMGANKAIGGNTTDNFPAGTRMLFQQTAAPTGWTKDTTHNNKALRIVSGTVTTGGSVAFTTAFSSARATTSVTQGGTVGDTAITVAQMPSHAHSVIGTTSTESAFHSHAFTGTGSTNTTGNHAHTTTAGSTYVMSSPGTGNFAGQVGTSYGGGAMVGAGDHSHTVSVSGTTGGQDASHTHDIAFTSSFNGSSQTHTHTFTGSAHSHTTDLAVQYVDVIVAAKDA